MLNSKSIYSFGYSGHAYVVIETALALGYEIKGYFDITEAVVNPYQIPYMGFENEVDLIIDSGFGENTVSTIVDLTENEPVILRQGKGILEKYI